MYLSFYCRSSNSTLHSSYVSALEFFLYVVVCAHVLACIFYMIPIIFECEKVVKLPDDDVKAKLQPQSISKLLLALVHIILKVFSLPV